MPHWVPQFLGYALSAGCLFWVFHRYRIADLLQQVRQLEWQWVALGVALDLSVYVCQAWRWVLLYRPVDRLPFLRTVQAIFVGLFANEVLPLRVGELIRCYLVAHWSGLNLSVVFASAGVERLIDGFWMLVSFLITAIFVRKIPEDLTVVVVLMGLLVLAGGVTLLWVV